jgi:long-chain acyl-CoA synthetase
VSIIDSLSKKWESKIHPALIIDSQEISFSEILTSQIKHLEQIQAGETVALIGDFNAQSIANFLYLVDLKSIIMPLSPLSKDDHQYFFDAAQAKWIVNGTETIKLSPTETLPLVNELNEIGHGGLVLFSSGTTGRPKAILHDMDTFLKRFETPRPTLRTLAFLLFDHIGGINTLLHTLFNGGTVVCTEKRDIQHVLKICHEFKIEVLPTTPTFLRLLLISGKIPNEIPPSLKIITYGTERMDESTLKRLCEELPEIDFRQTFGMSELGILRVKSKSRDSLFMKIGGEGVEWKIEEDLLLVKSGTRMLGYLNAESPFDEDGWYQTNDRVVQDGEYLKVVGRNNDIVNVGGLKFLLTEVERVAYMHPDIVLAKAVTRANPISGEHVEISVEIRESVIISPETLRLYFNSKLPTHMIPRKIKFEKIEIGHRHKKL